MRDRFSGLERAALLLMHMGQELASEVCKHLNPTEVQLLGATMINKESVYMESGKQVVKEFLNNRENGEVIVEGLEFAKSVITKALGADKAQGILDQISRDTTGGGIDTLKWMDPAIVANVIKGEHPQIIALILSHLDPERAAQVLIHIPEDRLRGEIMLRVSTLKRVPQAALKDLEVLLSEQMLNADSGFGSTIEGVKIAAEILNQMEPKSGGGIMEVIENASPDLASKIQEKMFVFSDLISIDDKGMQQIIKELGTDVLGLALKGSDESIKGKFLNNMSERAAEMLREDMEAKGPVKLSDVEKAQQEIIKIARRLEQEGKIMRAGKGGDVLV